MEFLLFFSSTVSPLLFFSCAASSTLIGAMAESLVGPITKKLTEKLIDVGFKYLKDQVRWQTGMKEELQRLQENHDKIRAVVSAAIKAQKIDQNREINNWIWRLRDAFDEADDLLDDFEYMKHEEPLTRDKARSTMSRIKKIGKRVIKSDRILKRLEVVVHKLDQISAEVNIFCDLLRDTQQEQKVQQDRLQNVRETGSMPKDVLIGRDQDREFVIQWLRKLPNEEHQSHVSAIPNMYHNISLLSIVGHGGMGKTTLLQHVYNDKVAEEFDLKMWICVSNNFDAKEVIKNMLESLTKTRPSSKLLDILQNKLQSEVMSKKFLLVLDDIWEGNEEGDRSKWGDVLVPLAHGGLGSKILITTRMDSAASMIAKVIKNHNKLLELKGLKNDDCLRLLNTRAFDGVEKPNDFGRLRSITEKLVKKLFGCPLAAKVIGGVLNKHLDERHWKNILNNVTGYNVMGYNGMLPILKLSYIFLPEYLQNCFAFCSIFAKDYVFYEDDLVRMWIAVGFIQPSNIQGEDLEDIGRRYIDDLVKKSLFEKDEGGYKMHDLLHDLAKSVSAQECFRIVGDKDSVLNIPPRTIRHLFVKTNNLDLLEKLGKFKNLRTLCISYASDDQHFVDALPKIFYETRSIRLLSIHACHQEMKPKAIGCLKHLRYLKIDFGGKFPLPRSVSKLFHLQFLICEEIDDIPWDMNNLSNLRYSNLPLFKCPGFGKLKFLHELKGFVVENKTGYRIGELEHMHDLHILKIVALENVRNVEEARDAKLRDKKKLTDLSLQWLRDKWMSRAYYIADVNKYARVLDNLQPHNNLKKLTVDGYMGLRPAIWMNNANYSINNLEHIRLERCLEWQNLPPFGQLPSLKSLHLERMPKAVRFDMHGLFPSLEKLYIANLEALEDWFGAGVDCLFPCLTVLSLHDSPNLKELPYLPPKIKKLTINNIGWQTLNYCSSSSKSILLETLVVKHCPNITIIHLTSEIIGRSAEIEIVDCPNLLSLGGHQEKQTTENSSNLIISDPFVLQMEPLRSVTSIDVLDIRDNDGLFSFPFEAMRWFVQGSSSLCTLFFTTLKSVQSRPSSLTSLSSIKKLFLYTIPLLKSLPDLALSLCRLKVGEIDNLDCPNIILDSLTISDPSVLRMEPLRSGTSIKELKILDNDGLTSFPFEAERWFSSLRHLKFNNLKSLQSLPSSLTSLSSLESLSMENVPQLQLQQSSLSALSSLNKLNLRTIPLLKSLPDLPPSLCSLELWFLNNLECLPSCLSSLSSLTSIEIDTIPLLRQIPNLPPSLCHLRLSKLDKLDCLPCLSSLSSLTSISITTIPLLRELPDLPPSLHHLQLRRLDKLDCLPSCLSSLSSLTSILLWEVPLLQELPDLPHSLKNLYICNCDPMFMKRYRPFNDSH